MSRSINHVAGLRFTSLALLLALPLSACDREHMSDDYGRKSRAFFAKQHAFALASSGAPVGLDSEESALIQVKYRKSLSGGDGQAPDQNSSSRVLLLQEPAHASTPSR